MSPICSFVFPKKGMELLKNDHPGNKSLLLNQEKTRTALKLRMLIEGALDREKLASELEITGMGAHVNPMGPQGNDYTTGLPKQKAAFLRLERVLKAYIRDTANVPDNEIENLIKAFKGSNRLSEGDKLNILAVFAGNPNVDGGLTISAHSCFVRIDIGYGNLMTSAAGPGGEIKSEEEIERFAKSLFLEPSEY